MKRTFLTSCTDSVLSKTAFQIIRFFNFMKGSSTSVFPIADWALDTETKIAIEIEYVSDINCIPRSLTITDRIYQEFFWYFFESAEFTIGILMRQSWQDYHRLLSSLMLLRNSFWCSNYTIFSKSQPPPCHRRLRKKEMLVRNYVGTAQKRRNSWLSLLLLWHAEDCRPCVSISNLTYWRRGSSRRGQNVTWSRVQKRYHLLFARLFQRNRVTLRPVL